MSLESLSNFWYVKQINRTLVIEITMKRLVHDNVFWEKCCKIAWTKMRFQVAALGLLQLKKYCYNSVVVVVTVLLQWWRQLAFGSLHWQIHDCIDKGVTAAIKNIVLFLNYKNISFLAGMVWVKWISDHSVKGAPIMTTWVATKIHRSIT